MFFFKNSREKNLQERNILCQEDLKVNKKNILIFNFPLSSLFSNVILKEKLDFFISDFFLFICPSPTHYNLIRCSVCFYLLCKDKICVHKILR